MVLCDRSLVSEDDTLSSKPALVQVDRADVLCMLCLLSRERKQSWLPLGMAVLGCH